VSGNRSWKMKKIEFNRKKAYQFSIGNDKTRSGGWIK